jgi:hypothetical protein
MGNGPSIKLSCDLDPQFTWRGLLFDIALCASDRPFPKTFLYENLDLNAATVQDKDDLFLLGYGCCKLPKPNEEPKTSAQLYGGLSTVTQLPKNPGDHIVTKGGVVICNGDSGGAAYVLVNSKVPTGPRSIVGMNSSYVQATRQSQIASLRRVLRRPWRSRQLGPASGMSKFAVCPVRQIAEINLFPREGER